MMYRYLVFILISFGYVVAANNGKRLLVLYLGGFRPDYLDMEELHGFNAFKKNGVHVDYMEPVFPTLTFPNYYSIMTGLYPDKHGILSDHMFDPIHYESFEAGLNPESDYPYWWNHAEPIWITTAKQNIATSLDSIFGCQVKIAKDMPTICRPYSAQSRSLLDSRNTLIKMVQEMAGDNSIRFAMSYINEVDRIGKMYGPSHEKTKFAVRQVDYIIQQVFAEIKKYNLQSSLNIIMFSDHGMEDCSPTSTINIAEYLGQTKVARFKEDGALMWIWAEDNKQQEVYQQIQNYIDRRPERKERFDGIYLRGDLPERYHIQKFYRMPPILVVAKPHWFLMQPGTSYPMFNDSSGKVGPMNGCNGYDNSYDAMKAIFLAQGPDFRTNVTFPPIKSVDIHQMMVRLLDMPEMESDGNWSRVEGMMRSMGTPLVWSSLNNIYLYIFVAAEVIIFFVNFGFTFQKL